MAGRPSFVPYLLGIVVILGGAKVLVDLLPDAEAEAEAREVAQGSTEAPVRVADERPEAPTRGGATEGVPPQPPGSAPSPEGEDVPEDPIAEPDTEPSEAIEPSAPCGTSDLDPDASRRDDEVSPTAREAVTIEIISQRPILHDVDGDGTAEVLAVFARSNDGRRWLTAMPAGGGPSLWSVDLGTDRATSVAVFPALNLLLVEADGVLSAIGARDGEVRWEVAHARTFSRANQRGRSALLLGDDGFVNRVDLDSGKIAYPRGIDLDAAHDVPVDSASTSWLRDPERVRAHWQPPFAALLRLPITDLFCPAGREPELPSEHASSRVACASTMTFGLATLDDTPALLGFETRGVDLTWTIYLLSRRSGRVLAEPGPAVTVVGDRGYVAFRVEGEPDIQLGRFSPATGEVRWRTLLSPAPRESLDIVADEHWVLLRSGRQLFVVDAETGAPQVCYGACWG